MEQCYSTVQGKKTNSYGKKQYEQLFTAFPERLRRLWDMEKGQVLEWQLNGDEDEIKVKKVRFKPTKSRMRYEEWLRKITPHVPTESPGRTYEEICKEVGLSGKAAPAIWVNRAKNDIGLNNMGKDTDHHKLWFRSTQSSETVSPKTHDGKDQKQSEPKFRDQSLREFQANYDERSR
jgi:hypothetical protein